MLNKWQLLGSTLTAVFALSCRRDKPPPAYVKTIVVPPRDTAAMNAHRNDSVFVILHAARALHIEHNHPYQLVSYQHTDSGTLITMIPKCPPPPVRCLGGGGLVVVDSLGKAKVLHLFR